MKHFFTLVFLVLSTTVFSQGLDSSLFVSDFEFAVFEQQLLTQDANPIDLLVCGDGGESESEIINQRIKQLEDELVAKGLNKKSEKAKIKLIYKTVHSSMLSLYSEDIYFSDIFSNGRYNCVTASALYAAVLDHFNVPYQIKETPNHVYLIADPDNTQILLESTNPSNGVVVYDARNKRQYVDYLVNNKIITEYEMATSSVDVIFEEFHNKDKDIDIIELAGLQYYNRGASAFNLEDYKKATINLQKAQMLYTSTNINFLLEASFTNLFHDQYLNKTFSGKDLARFTNLVSENTKSKLVAVNFYEVAMDEYLINKGDLNRFNTFHDAFYADLNDTISTDLFDEVYYAKMGFYAYSQDDYNSSLEYFNLAYLGDPDNLRLKTAVQEMVMLTVSEDDNYPAMVDSLDYYFDVYPFLSEKDRFQKLYLYANIMSLGEAADNEDMKKVDYYVVHLEEFLVNANPRVYTEAMEQIYDVLASQLMYNGDSKASIDYINRGLALMPNSERLKARKKEILKYNSYLANRSVYIPIASRLTPEAFSKKFNENFPECWQATKIRINGTEEAYHPDNDFTINASKFSKVTVGKDAKSQYGRWAMRSKSKLLYLIPENDKDNYLMFKIVDITENRLELRLYEGKSCSKDVLIFTKCK
jgi:tetratricopeptide (TPR) repeat protein